MQRHTIIAANALNELKRHEEALASYDKAIALKPDFEFLLGDLIHTKMKICDWSNLETQIAQLVHKIDHSRKSIDAISTFSNNQFS